MKIKEIIVVEGKDDERAIKRAVDAEVIITSGFGIREETFRRIEFARQQKGVILFTDPDFAGEQIRDRINRRIKGCKQAYLSKTEALKKHNIGIENANPESIVPCPVAGKMHPHGCRPRIYDGRSPATPFDRIRIRPSAPGETRTAAAHRLCQRKTAPQPAEQFRHFQNGVYGSRQPAWQ